MRVAVSIVIVISTREVFLRVWRHLIHFSTKTGTRKINGGRKLSEIKVQKTWFLMFVIDWNLARFIVHENVNKWISTIWSQWHFNWVLMWQAFCILLGSALSNSSWVEISEWRWWILSSLITAHDEFDSADPGRMQDAWEVMGSISVGDSDILFVPRSCHVD